MAIRGLIFDLDDTLIVDEAVNSEVLDAVASDALHHGASPDRFVDDVHALARSRWQSGPMHGLCKNIGISAYECLWGNFRGHSKEYHDLADWAESYRVEVFEEALRRQLENAPDVARELSDAFVDLRRKAQRLMPDAMEVLTRLSGRHWLALLTNGSPRFQREKLAVSGLERFFTTVVVSGEYGVGKPQGAVFDKALAGIGAKAEEAVMIGNSLERDIEGAKRAGITAVWLRVPGAEEHAEVKPDHTITALAELEPVLAALAEKG